MSLVRLSAALPEGSNRAHAAFALAGDFADRAADLAGRPRRALPELPDPAAGDVLSVCGNDLAEELRAAPADPLGAAAICRTAVAELVALRRLL